MSPRSTRRSMTRPISLMSRGLDAFGRLVEDQELRPGDERPERSAHLVCCCAAGEIAAAPAEHVLQDREQLVDVVGNAPQRAGQGGKPGLQILQHGEPRKDLAALRHQRQPAARALVRRHAGEVAIFPGDPSRTDRLQPEDRAQQAGLADAVAAEDAGHLAALRLQAYPAQRIAGAVIEIDRLDRQHRLFPGHSEVFRHPGESRDPRIGKAQNLPQRVPDRGPAETHLAGGQAGPRVRRDGKRGRTHPRHRPRYTSMTRGWFCT